MNKLNIVYIYTDGACKGNPGVGGWGAILKYENKEKEINGFSKNTTNNIMELTAVIEALKQLNRNCEIIESHIEQIVIRKNKAQPTEYPRVLLVDGMQEVQKRNWNTHNHQCQQNLFRYNWRKNIQHPGKANV